MRFSFTLTVALTFVSGCTDTPSPTQIVKQAQLAAPEELLETSSVVVGDYTYFSDSDTSEVRRLGGDGWAQFPFPDAFIPYALLAPKSNELWVLGRGAVALELRSYDLDVAGNVETATHAALFTSTVDVSIGAIAFDEDSGTLYMLHFGVGDIYVARDTSGDLVPDEVQSALFVKGNWDPDELEPQVIEFEDPETGQTMHLNNGLSAKAGQLSDATANSVYASAPPGIEVGLFKDTDGDGVADEVEDVIPFTVVPPIITNGPVVTGMKILLISGTDGAFVELQKLHPDDTVDQILATVELENGSAFVELAMALAEGDRLRTKDTTNDETGAIVEVAPAQIHIDTPVSGPLLVDVTEGVATLTLEGANLNRVQSIGLRQELGGLTETLTFTVAQDGRSITINFPGLPEDWDGTAFLDISEGDIADDDEPFYYIFCVLCTVDDEGSGESGGAGN